MVIGQSQDVPLAIDHSPFIIASVSGIVRQWKMDIGKWVMENRELAMKADVTDDPVEVRLFCAIGEMTEARGSSALLEQFHNDLRRRMPFARTGGTKSSATCFLQPKPRLTTFGR